MTKIWIASLDGVDVVFGGDSHSLLGDDKTGLIASPTGSYATVVEKPNGSKTCVVQAWEYSKAIGNLDVDFDKDGNVLSRAGSPVFPFNPDVVTVRDADPRYDMSAADALAVITSLSESTGGQVKGFTEDADAASDLEAYAMVVDELTKEVVGFASTFIGLENGGSESGSCDLVAQGFLLSPISNADVSIQNTGGCRASIEDGNFSINDAFNLLPFSNTMVNIVMTGEQIKYVLEDAVDYYLDPEGASGAYPRASGLRFNVNEAQEKGSRISNLEVNAELAGSWKAIDMFASYTVVTNSYIAAARDGYIEFGYIASDLKVDTYVEYAQSFIDYSLVAGTLDPVSAGRASTQTWTDTFAPTASPTKVISKNQKAAKNKKKKGTKKSKVNRKNK